MATSTVLLVGKDSPMAQMRRDAEKQGLPPKLKMHLQTLAGVAAILALVVATGVGPHDDHGDDDGDEHGGDDHGGEEHGGHHNHIAIDLQVSLGIVAGLVAVTILFEKGKEYAEEHVPPLMQNVLEALFGELTVLGFIALVRLRRRRADRRPATVEIYASSLPRPPVRAGLQALLRDGLLHRRNAEAFKLPGEGVFSPLRA